MILREGVTQLMHRLYANEADELDWLEGIREAAIVALPGCSTIQVHTARFDGARMVLHNVAGEARSKDLFVQLHELAEPQILHDLYFSGPITPARPIVATSSDESLRATFEHTCAALSIAHGFGVTSVDTDGRALVLSFAFPSPRLPARARTALGRLSGHLTAANRLRRTTSRPAALICPREGVVREEVPLEEASKQKLHDAAIAIDRARRMSSHDPEAALGYWKAMVEGRWTLVERFETDGRRILVARPNEPTTQKNHELTANERKVVSLVAVNHPAKLVAYELGFSESTTSKLLATSLRKMGLRNRAELVELRTALLANGSRPDHPSD